MDCAKNLLIESYSEKYLSRRLCGGRADRGAGRHGAYRELARSNVDMTS